MSFSVSRHFSLFSCVCCGDGRALDGSLNELCGCADKSMIKSNDINNVMYLPALSLTRPLHPPQTTLLTFMPPWLCDFASLLCTINDVSVSLCFVIICIFYLCRLFLSAGLSSNSLPLSLLLPSLSFSLSIDPVIVFSVFTVLGRSNQYR